MGYDKTAWHPRDYASMSELVAELDRLEAAQQSGSLKTSGKWNAGQIFEHCAKLMRFSFDGFEAKAPKLLQVFGSMYFKPKLGKSHMKPGIKLPAKASSLLPRDDVSFEEGLAELRFQIDRIEKGEKMQMESPILGTMTHEQWLLLHLDHCRMHFGFIRCD